LITESERNAMREYTDASNWKGGLIRLLVSKEISGFALIDTTGVVVFGYGDLVDGFMIRPDSTAAVSEKLELEKNEILSALQMENTPSALSIRGRKMVVVRRESAMLYAVGEGKQCSVSLHNMYAGVLVVTYGPRYPPALDAVLHVLQRSY